MFSDFIVTRNWAFPFYFLAIFETYGGIVDRATFFDFSS